MKRNKDLRLNRIKLVQVAFNDPKKGAKILEDLAKGLANTKTAKDTVFALSQIFGVSEKTILRDILNDIDI